MTRRNALSNSEAQVWKSHNFSITADTGDEPDAVIFRLVGPFTARDMYSTLSPNEVRQVFETLPAKKQPSAQVFDLSGVPYMDELEIFSIPDTTARLNAVLSGQVHGAGLMPFAQAKAYATQGSGTPVNVQVNDGPSECYISLGCSYKPFNDVRVR